MNVHAQAVDSGPPRDSASSILERLERLIRRDPDAQLPRDLLVRDSIWKKLKPHEALRWAMLAQAAGLLDLGIEVLSWINSTDDTFQPAWQARLDLLQTLGRKDEAADLEARLRKGTAPGRVLDQPGAGNGVGVPEGKHSSRGTEANIDGPFHSMRREEELLTRFLNLFQGREDCFARQWADRKANTQGYIPVRRSMLMADVRDHIRGLRTYGIYLLQRDSRVRLAVVDADLAARFRTGSLKAAERDSVRREKSYLLDRLPEVARENGLPCLVEFSGGKGFHFWFFLRDPIPASAARQALQRVAQRVGPDLSCFSLEVFPKQDQLAGKGLGNLVKLPLGIHRGTGKRSFFTHIHDRSDDAQLAALEKVELIPADRFTSPDAPVHKGRIVAHPKSREWAGGFPELAILAERCAALGQVLSGCRRSRQLTVREEKILFATLGFLPRGKAILHQVLQWLPEYNPHLTDFKLSRLRGTPLGCKRIHALLNLVRDPCLFPHHTGYAHPLLHWPEWSEELAAPRSERITNLADALQGLQQAIGTVQRFLKPHGT